MARVSNLDEFKSDVVLQIRDERGKGLDLADQYDMRKNTPDLLYSKLHGVELRDRGKVAKNASTYPIKSGAELAAYLKQVGGGCELHFAFGPTEMACKQAHTERQLAETALRTAAAKV